QPTTYLGAALAQRSKVSSIDPTPLYPFGHGLTYTTFGWEDARLLRDEVPTGGPIEVAVPARTTGGRAGTEVVQLYLHDPVAQVTRPVVWLAGYCRVSLESGEAATVRFTVPTDLASFTGRRGQRIVEPGRIELRLGRSSAEPLATWPVELTGPERVIDAPRQLTSR